MTSSQFISVRETAQILGVTEKKVMDLIEQRQLQAYRIADKFLRLKRDEVLNIRNIGTISRDNAPISYSQSERISDFFYYNDFYLACIILLFVLLYFIFYT